MAEVPLVPKYTVPTLYRRLLKTFIKKFDTDHSMIIKAAKQTRYEFWYLRNATGEDALAARIRGEEVMKAVVGGIVPIYSNPETGETYCKYDKEALAASGNVMDPISGEEYLRRYHDRIPEKELKELQQMLVEAGRWEGPLEFKPEEALKIKVKKMRRKCSDPEWDQSKAVEEQLAEEAAGTAKPVDSLYGDIMERAEAALEGKGECCQGKAAAIEHMKEDDPVEGMAAQSTPAKPDSSSTS